MEEAILRSQGVQRRNCFETAKILISIKQQKKHVRKAGFCAISSFMTMQVDPALIFCCGSLGRELTARNDPQNR